MKKILAFIACLAVALLAFSSCEKEEETGKVTYTVGSYTGELSNDDIDSWSAIEKLFNSEIAAVEGVTKDVKKYVMQGNYAKCDAAILNACKSAEKKAEQYTLKGHFTLKVDALYEKGGTTANIYTHVFGKQ
ncbi:MAG: hypothetical protein J5699_08495 [Bacteroidales bacterium]|nr:hypothetical protein [Bacteroidales bacterium]